MTTETRPPAEPIPHGNPRRGRRYLQSLKIPIALLCGFGIFLTGYYFLYVQQQQRYLTGRNFRVLATIGAEMQATLDSARTILQSFLRDEGVFDEACGDAIQDCFADVAADYAPILRSIDIDRWDCSPGDAPVPASDLALRFVEAAGAADWVIGSGAAPDPCARASLNLNAILAPLLEGEIQDDLFVALTLATSGGRVVVHTGDPRLRVFDVHALVASAGQADADRVLPDVLNSPTVVNVDLAGSRYLLFLQPCCTRMTHTAADGAAGQGWVVGGFVPRDRMRRAGLAFPVTGVLALSVVLLLSVFSWPFLKLLLISDLQPVRTYDVLLVGVCGLLGLALLTLGALDLYAYRKLTTILDGQLVHLAGTMEARTHAEIADASAQLDRLQQLTRLPSAERRISDLADPVLRTFDDADFAAYPFFSSFALIRNDGFQQMKWTFAPFVTPLVQVADRDYVRHWAEPRADAFYLDSIRSRTTGEAEAILSRPAGDGTGDVLALTIPLFALLDPVVVPGFGFAVINDRGEVLFHSDSEHNLSESLFAETDQSRRLRALVEARHAELIDVRYWGEDHRAFVQPLRIGAEPWTLVTFYDKQLVRTVNADTLISGVFYTFIYAAAFLLMALGLLVFRPLYRAPWLWPDAARAPVYLRLLLSQAACLVAFVVALAAFPPDRLLWASWLLPFFAWSVTHLALHGRRAHSRPFDLSTIVSALLLSGLVANAGTGLVPFAFDGLLLAAFAWGLRLARRPAGASVKLAPPLNLSYGLGAALLILLTTVLPAAGFFAVAYGIHTQNLVKYGQLALARELQDRRLDPAWLARFEAHLPSAIERLTRLRTDWRTRHDGAGRYDRFFFGTTLASAACRPAEAHVELPAALEGLLPYYSEASARLRELMHGRAADGSWHWQQDGRTLLFCMNQPIVQGRNMLSSVVPPLIGTWPIDNVPLTLVLVVGLLVVLAITVAVVRFIMRRIFVVGLIEPLWSGRQLRPSAARRSDLIVLGRGSAAAKLITPAGYDVIDFATVEGGDDARRAWFAQQIERLARLPSDVNVLLLHFDHGAGDRNLDELRLSLVERLVEGQNRMVAVVSGMPVDRLFAHPAESPDGADGDSDLGRRWEALRAGFGLLPAGDSDRRQVRLPDRPRIGWKAESLAESLWRLNALSFSRRAAFLEDESRDPFVASQWNQVLPYAWHPDTTGPLDLDQLLVEVGDRAENYYQALWASCSPEERTVLGHVARERFVNEKSSRIVRGLMAKGLVHRRPTFDVMTETFRRFVRAQPSEPVTDSQAQRSAWDSIRWPFSALVAAMAVVFFVTQQELFQQTVGIATAVAAGFPALIRLVSLVGGRTGGAD